MNYLVDTTIFAELARVRPNSGVTAWAAEISKIAVSVVSVEEIFYGLAWKPNTRIEAWFDSFLVRSCEIIPVTDLIARQAGKLRGRLQALGKPRTQADMLIAATGAAHGFTIVTRNEKDFRGCGVQVLNPFTPG